MCLVVLSSAHPEYPLVLISNRDEFLSRKTLRANWWQPPDEHILGGRDQQRAEQGTWLGITRQGRLAVLTNYREEGQEYNSSARSRGTIPISYLKGSQDELPEAFAKRLVEEEGVSDVGGFSLIFGTITADARGRPFGIVSNRTPNVKGVVWLDGDGRTYGQTCALSNSNYGDTAWPKVVKGEQLLDDALRKNVAGSESMETLLGDLFGVLSTDSLPRKSDDEDWATYSKQLRNSIFIPLIGAESEAERGAQPGSFYATQKQTVILVDRRGKVCFVERTLYDNDSKPVSDKARDSRFEFQIEGWSS